VGRRLHYYCPARPGGRLGRLWGSGPYTDDSSICTAAAHAGVITRAAGGRVTVQIRPGARRYLGSRSHGVTSRGYGPWKGSFEVVGARQQSGPARGAGGRGGGPRRITCRDTATRYRGQVGRRHTLRCPPASRLGPVWGTVVYTDDSSICTAAVHAGVITQAGGGVTIEIAAGFARYPASRQHGVHSRVWARWSGSFAFP